MSNRKDIASQDKQDIYTIITNKIIADLEKGNLTWAQPWQAGHAAGAISRPLRAEGKPYQGINTLILWIAAMDKGYDAPIWMTYKQAQELGAQVRKGEKGTQVVYSSKFTAHEKNEAGEEIEKDVPFLKTYTVFNVEQIEGLPGHFYAKVQPLSNHIERIEQAEQFFKNTNAEIRHGGNQAFYSPTHDFVQMPKIETFKDAESYYGVLGHEMTHWTRHTSRLNRDFGRKRWGDEGYAMEELVAELGAAFLCADLGLTLEPKLEHAAYIDSWLKVLKQDKKAIFHAASHAERAANHLHSYQNQIEPDPQPESESPQSQVAALAEEAMKMEEQPQIKALTELVKEPSKESYVQGSLFN